MPNVFEKLNLKDQQHLIVLNAPPSFEPELARLKGRTLHRALAAAPQLDFFLAFVTLKAEVERLAPQLAKRAPGGPVLWFAYPKGTSKKYTCDFNRDTGWDALRALGFDTVRAVAIDEDWSALRFRRTEFIKVK
ncbi:MAG TPA: hypothetical protein VMV57_09490 [Terracidiphilus sp.]|nr:hypothetical protein [Terracidiphilus sp.]